jgi:SsrA-binding protein
VTDSKKRSEAAIAENRKARFNYTIQDTYEAGLVLLGTEVKSCREGKVNLSDGYATFRGGDLILQNVQITEYTHGNRTNHTPRRVRKLLLHNAELKKLIGLLQAGYSLIPLKMYFKNRYAKVLLGLGKGKKAHDKRESIKKREANREMARQFRR